LDLKEARLKLRKQDIYVIDIKEDAKAQSAAGKGTFLDKLNRKPPTAEDVAIATKQLAILISAAVDINEAIKAVADQVENQELKSVYIRIRDLISEGKSLSDAHKQFPEVFSNVYVNMIAAGERAGALGIVLSRLSSFMLYQIAIKRKLIGALTYPAILFVASIAVTIFLFVNVIPKMMGAFKSLNAVLPWYTLLVNDISVFLQEWWLPLLGGFIGTIVLLFLWTRTKDGRYKFDKFLFKSFYIGDIVQRVAISRFSKTLSTVLSSGVRIVEALHLTKVVVGNLVLEEGIEETIRRVQDGEKLAAALEKTGYFPPMVIHMLRTGEKTGKIEDMLVHIADIYDDEVDNQISMSTRFIEPIMLVFLGFIVILVVVSVIEPMMSVMNSVGG
jgi:general secretion pathway protein F